MSEELGVIEAIEKTASIVDSYKKEVLEEARIFSMKVSPETTPDNISEYRQVIGTPKHFRDIESAANEIDQELSPSSKEHYFDIATFLEVYQYLYLINGKENPAEVYTGRNEALRVSTANVMSSIENSLEYWEKADRSQGFTVSPDPAGSVLKSMSLLCMYYFPKEDISKVESKIKAELKEESLKIDSKLLEALTEFPSQFNRRTAHYNNESKLDFFYTYTHEFSHAYVNENAPENDLAFNEATSQFISRYLESAEFDKNGIPSKSEQEGIKFENSPEKYASYDEQYYQGASEDIYIITEFMKLKAMEKVQSNGLYDSRSFNMVDWLIKEEIRAINQCKEENNNVSRKGVLRYYVPVELQQETRSINNVIENELNPLINEIKDFLGELENYKEFHYHEWSSKINEVLKNAVNQDMTESEFEDHLEEEAEERSKLHDIERTVKKDLRNLQKIRKKDHLELDQIYEVVENLPEDPDPTKELEKIKDNLRPDNKELRELREDLKDLESLKSEIVEHRDKSKSEISEISHKGYEVNIRELEKKEMETVNELINKLEKLEQECKKVRKDLKSI